MKYAIRLTIIGAAAVIAACTHNPIPATGLSYQDKVMYEMEQEADRQADEIEQFYQKLTAEQRLRGDAEIKP